MKHVLSLTSILFTLTFGFSSLADGVHGVFRVVKGTVKIKSAQGGQEARARLGTKVLPGDVIITEKDSRAKIVMVDNNEINVSPDSQIKIEKYEYNPEAGKKDVLLNVIYGKVRSKVEQKYDGKTSKFQVKTPSAVAGVRGTDFLAGFNQQSGNSQVITFEGRVEFGTPGPGGQIMNAVSVVPGQMAEMGRGGAPTPPVAVPQENLKQMDQETNAETASGGPAGKSDDRKPASKEGSKRVILKDKDLPGAPSEGGPTGPPGPPPLPPPPIRTPTALQPCDFCQRVIEGGNTNLNITVKTQ